MSQAMRNYYPLLMPGIIYHIYNRGNNRQNLFYGDRNYQHFLRLYETYVSPVAETFAYCILPNHVHFLVRIKSAEEIMTWAKHGGISKPRFEKLQELEKEAFENELSKLISSRFRIYFMAYAKAINRQEKRIGSLFQKNFKRKAVEQGQYLTNVLLYIHTNPELHGICKDFRQWQYSSFQALLSEKRTDLQKASVIEWFGGVDNLIQWHENYLQWQKGGDWLLGE
jgi:putative transposase